MKWIMKIFFSGLVTALPITLSLYVLYWFFTGAEGLMRKFINLTLPQVSYRPGMGWALALIIVFALGLLMTSPFMQRVYRAIEMPFNKVPLIKSIYSAIKDLMNFFSPDSQNETGKVVSVRFPETSIEMIGFLTRENLATMPENLDSHGRVAVYFPMSYQVGGYTLFLPKKWIQEIDMSVEEAMRSALTAWMHKGNKV